MARAESSSRRRDRGRPQLRPDDETRQIIYEAARHEFAANGYAATSTETLARRAGISTNCAEPAARRAVSTGSGTQPA